MGEPGKENWSSRLAWAGLRGGDSDVKGGDELRPPLGLRIDGRSLRSRSRSGGVSGERPPDAEWVGVIRGVGESRDREGRRPWWWWCLICAFRSPDCGLFLRSRALRQQTRARQSRKNTPNAEQRPMVALIPADISVGWD